MHFLVWADQPLADPFPYGNVLDMNDDHTAIFVRVEEGKILWVLGKVVPEKNSITMLSHGVVVEGLRKPSVHSVSIDNFGTVIVFYSEKSDSQKSNYIVGMVEVNRRIHWSKPLLFNDYSMAGQIRSARRSPRTVAVWSEHMTAMSNINAQVGDLDRSNLTIKWSNANKVEGGGFPTLGLNNLDYLVQIHATDFLFSDRWYCRSGRIDSQSHEIFWNDSEKIGKARNYYTIHPVSLLDSQVVLEMHAQTKLGPDIWLRFGMMDSMGKVAWETDKWSNGGPGGWVAFACSNDGTVLVNKGSRMPFNPDSLWLAKIQSV